jgi:CDP-4-dehydro-6-deoxyglucose reductase
MTIRESTTQEFLISVKPSARSFQAGAFETILAAAIRQGVGMPYGCKDGACGSCKCKKLVGSVVHGPHQSKALSDVEEAAGFILTCCGVAHSDIVLESSQVTQADAFPIHKMPTRVSALERKSPDVILLTLQLPTNESFSYHPGQYVEFLLKGGVRRSYSVANAPHKLSQGCGLELHIRHLPGGQFTDHVFSAMKEREILRIEGPYGSFFLREDCSKPIILLASGTGFAPLKAMLEHMQHKSITRATTLYWGGRRPQDLYLDDWVRARLAKMPRLRYVPVISDALPEDHWSGRSGFVHRAVLQDLPDLSPYQVYACGAPIMIDAARADFARAGLPADEFYADAFTSEADKLTKAS